MKRRILIMNHALYYFTNAKAKYVATKPNTGHCKTIIVMTAIAFIQFYGCKHMHVCHQHKWW